jgi:hypothetical protein
MSAYQDLGIEFAYRPTRSAKLIVRVGYGDPVVIEATAPTSATEQELVWDLLLMLEGVEATLRALGQTEAADRAEQLGSDIYDIWQRVEFPYLDAQDAR